VAAYQHYLLIVQLRHGESLSSGLEVSQAHYQLDAATAQESGLRAQRAVFEHMIATLVGKPASEFSLPPRLTDIAIPVIPTGVPSAAPARHRRGGAARGGEERPDRGRQGGILSAVQHQSDRRIPG
jgi:outer membrane protein TolC